MQVGLMSALCALIDICCWILEFCKQSAKGVTADARRRLTHEMFRKVLESGDFVRLVNTRIASSHHQLCTLVVNKKSLSGYYDKRYILPNKISTLPFGHFSLREEMFERAIADDTEWGLSELESDIEEISRQVAVNTSNSFLPPEGTSWTPPDPGLAPREYTESDLEDVVDFDNISENDLESEHEIVHNPFIDYEAEESFDDDVPVYEISDPESDQENVGPSIKQDKRPIETGEQITPDSFGSFKTPINSKKPILEETTFDPLVMTPYENEPQRFDSPEDIEEFPPEQPGTSGTQSQRKFTGKCLVNIDSSNEVPNRMKPKRKLVRKLFLEPDDENKENIHPPTQRKRRRRAVILDSSDSE